MSFGTYESLAFQSLCDAHLIRALWHGHKGTLSAKYFWSLREEITGSPRQKTGNAEP